MNTADSRTDTAVNVANAVLGGILFVTPWLFGFTDRTWASWNAWLSGGIVVLIALSAVVRVHDWEEWLNAIAGLWITASPWLLWFEDVRSALWAHVVIGGCIVALAAVELRRLYVAPEGVATPRR